MEDELRMARLSNGEEKAEHGVVEGAHEAQVRRSLSLENSRKPWIGAKPLSHTQALESLNGACRWDANDR